ncbi:MAG: GAF domain-containing protein [Sphingomonas bacterium]|nr:GAF domain-containing protein [Sphingomonas bacterium]
MTEPQMIQPIGFHLGLSSEWLVTAVSANIGEFLKTSADLALGQPITSLLSNDDIHDIRNRMALLRSDETVEHLFQFPLAGAARAYDLAIYRSGNGFGIDVEPCDERSFGDATGILEGMLARVAPSDDIGQLCHQASDQLRALTGFQHVVISAGQETLGQSMRAGPAPIDVAIASSDRDMVVFDRDAAAVPIQVVGDGWSPRRLTLRAPTGSEVANLGAIGARAALVVPLDRNGQPWGQAACYHASPRHVSAERRNIARLFASIMSLRIEIAELRRAV